MTKQQQQQQHREEFNYSCGCSLWFLRFITWATTAAAFGLSLASLDTCFLISGRAIYYDIPDSDISKSDLIKANVTAQEAGLSSSTEPPDPLLAAVRERPGYDSNVRFHLGVYKAAEWGGDDTCLPYDHGYTEEYMSAGPAEGAARFFGTLAATLGGLAMVCFFAFMMIDIPRLLYLRIVTGILVTAAFCQMFIFVLHASRHCQSEFWKDFLSRRTQLVFTTVGVGCELGEDGWYAVVAVILYLFAALLVSLKWMDPTLSVFNMDWTKEGNYPVRRRHQRRVRRVAQPGGGDDVEQQSSRRRVMMGPQIPPSMDTIQREMKPLVPPPSPPPQEEEEEEDIPVHPSQTIAHYEQTIDEYQEDQYQGPYQEESYTVEEPYQGESYVVEEVVEEAAEEYPARASAGAEPSGVWEDVQRSNSPTLIRPANDDDDDNDTSPTHDTGSTGRVSRDPPTYEHVDV